MPQTKSSPPLRLHCNGQYVGKLIRDEKSGVTFTYDERWLQQENAIPISLSMPLTEIPYRHEKVIPVIENLLPDDSKTWRTIAIEAGAGGSDVFSLLARIGGECVGAFQFVPEGVDVETSSSVQGEPLSDVQIGEMLSTLGRNPLGIQSSNQLRITVAGAQAKTALLHHNNQWMVPLGSTPTTHILKPQIGKLNNGLELSQSVENEYFCLKLMQQFGLRVADAAVVDFGDQRTLVVKRFDREWVAENQLVRLPQEDFCQVLSVPPHRKYQDEGGPGIVEILTSLAGSEQPDVDRRDFLKANVLFWLTSAIDGHAKNFSVALLPDERFLLTPIYDVISVQDSVAANLVDGRKLRLAMRAGKRRRYRVAELSGRDYAQTAVKAGMSEKTVESLFAEIHELATTAVDNTANELPAGFPEQIVTSVAGAIQTRLKFLTAERSRW